MGIPASDDQKFEPRAITLETSSADVPELTTAEPARPNRSPATCEECNLNPAKYRCPACGLRSCGLPCVDAHKRRTSCTGKRDRTAFVPISEFNDNWLHSDFHLLEDISREADAAKRIREPFGPERYRMTPNMAALMKQAKNRNISLLFLAQGMTRRQANTSYFQKKWKRICWRIEWILASEEVHLVDAQVDENTSLKSALEKHLLPRPGVAGAASHLRPYAEVPMDQLKFFMRKEPCRADKQLFYSLQSSESLGSQLAYKCIIEFPLIHVALPNEADRFPLVPESSAGTLTGEQGAKDRELPLQEQPEPIPMKVFVEEEIEEGELL